MATPILKPSPRASPFTAILQGSLVLWGGGGDSEPEGIFMFDVDTESWTKDITKGPHPQAELQRGGCAVEHERFYIYGGNSGSEYHGSLFELSTGDWTWRELCKSSVGGPGRKVGCKAIIYKHQLLVIGGYYKEKPETVQLGLRYENGWTNEVHCCDLTAGI